VECLACHFEPGVVGAIRGEAYAGLKLIQFFIGAYEAPTGAELVRNVNCLRCHEEVLTKKIDLAGGLAFYHEKHVDRAKAECRQCHTAIGHPGAVATAIVTEPPRINKDVCLRCHDGRGAPVVFGAATPSSKTHPAEPRVDTGIWKQTHWQAAVGTATIAGKPFKIDPAACAACHGQPTEAAACRSCHLSADVGYAPQTQNCLRCHGPTMAQKLELDSVPFYHDKHLLRVRLVCQDCHRQVTHQQICANCHDGQRAPAIFGSQ
jgi:hypothetical protein